MCHTRLPKPGTGHGRDSEKTSEGKLSSKSLLKFLLFSLKKSSKQNAETRQARPQLHFAPKIIKIHLTVLENGLIEVCVPILKLKKTPCFHVIIAHSKVLYQSFNKYVHVDLTYA